MEHRRFSQTMASEWQTAFVVSHIMPWCTLLTAVKNYKQSLVKLQDVFFKTETKTKCSRPRPRLHDPRLSFLSLRCLETKTRVSRTKSLREVRAAWELSPARVEAGTGSNCRELEQCMISRSMIVKSHHMTEQ